MPTTYAIPDGRTVMAATTFTGVTGGGSVDNTVNGVGFKPDFVWMKTRSTANNHELADSVRGTPYALFSNLTNAEVSDTRVSAFNSNGFSYGTNSNSAVTGRTSVGWQWQAGQGTTSSNTSGSITSTVSVNATAGFSVVTYTGVGGLATVGHGLGVAPKMIIVMPRSFVSDKYVYLASIGAANYMSINLTSASASTTLWNSTSPTSTVFTVNGNGANQNTSTFVAYCWAEVAGYSKFGSYTGNGSADGPFVYCGFRPRWLMVKASSTTSDWVILDTSRNTYNVVNNTLWADLSNAESTAYSWMDILSNGFKLRDSANGLNNNGATYIFAAFGENPFKFANAR